MLEGFVVELAEVNRRIEGFNTSPDHFRRSRLKSAQRYFKTVAKLSFPDQTKEWKELDRLFLARHAIVHAWGRIEDIGKRADVAIVKGFTVSPKGEVWLDSEALPSAITVMEAFVDRLEEHLGGKQDA
jgi:hypothetical protein